MTEEEINMQEISSAELARQLGVSARTVQNWLASGDLEGRQTFAGRWFIKVGNAKAFITKKGKDRGEGAARLEAYLHDRFQEEAVRVENNRTSVLLYGVPMSAYVRDAESSRVPRRRGENARERIKAELRRRRAAGLAAPTLEELAEAAGLVKSTIHHHLAWLEEHGIIRIAEARRQIQLLDGEGADHGQS